MMVRNQAQVQAFEMAALGYKTFKNVDWEEARKYKEKMNQIMSFRTNGDNSDDELPVADEDSDNDMPSLNAV